jgi:pimeloyl-ACP methyl ester carboxylesterase
MSGCENGITCREVPANGLIFNCRFAGNATDDKPGVLLLHGFPEWSSMYMDLMR